MEDGGGRAICPGRVDVVASVVNRHVDICAKVAVKSVFGRLDWRCIFGEEFQFVFVVLRFVE